jgi:dethiobiotin synthetase
MHGVFITGTNTHVGKTYLGVLLARHLTEHKITVIPRKPIESGCEKVGDELIPADALALQQAAQYSGSLAEVCPFRFEPPISPVRAAHLANKVLTTEQLVNICMQGSEKGFLLVEGAGGFYSPLSENGLNADLATALQLPVLLVAHDELGVLNQVLLNVEAMKMRGLTLAGVVLNTLDNTGHAHMDNAADLRQMLDCPVFSLPYQPYQELEAASLPDELMERVLSQHDRRKLTRLATAS